ncbi:MAG TPA: hypothetical protein VHY48_01650 [Acidobacteriaceae bacterium]|jgi:hypothetical protein|nr:hypothetical protein [Acidobacteriaceae bacterium]
MGTHIAAGICIVFFAVFAVLVAKPVAEAKSAGARLVVNVPFAFQLGPSHLSCGTYRLKMYGNDLLSMLGDSGSTIILAGSAPGARPFQDSAIVFHHYGDRYFLREVRIAGDEGFLWSAETGAERQARQDEESSNPDSGPREDPKLEIALLAAPR